MRMTHPLLVWNKPYGPGRGALGGALRSPHREALQYPLYRQRATPFRGRIYICIDCVPEATSLGDA